VEEMRKVIIPHNGERVIYEGKDIRVEVIGIDLWITPKTQRIRRYRKKHYITKAKPIPTMTREEFVERFNIRSPNWTYGLPIEQRELLMEAMDILPITGDLESRGGEKIVKEKEREILENEILPLLIEGFLIAADLIPETNIEDITERVSRNIKNK